MHSKIFHLSIGNIKDEGQLEEEYYYMDEESIADNAEVDYATAEDETDFKDSVNILKEFYDLKNVSFTIRKLPDGDTIPIAIIKKEEIVEALKEEKEARLKEIEKLLPTGDLWNIARVAYNDKGFYFILNQYGVLNSVDLYEILRQPEMKKIKDIYIIKTYDYHW